jgi:hypothetical protein
MNWAGVLGHVGGMWTKEHRARQSGVNWRDLTNEECERVRPLLPKSLRRGGKAMVDLREMLNAIRYMARSGEAGACCRCISGCGKQCIGGSGVLCAVCCSRPSTMLC